MKFSLLIAHFNNEIYFKDCYASILEQTYKNWEVVILDDDSKADSWEAVKKLVGNDERFRFFKNESNQGVGVTKSKLIELASGEIGGFLDPDDALKPNAIEKAMEVYQKDPKVVLTYSQLMQCDSDLQPIKPFEGARQVLNGQNDFFNYPVQIAHFVTFKKSIYEETEKMDSHLKIAEDQDLYLKMYEKGKVQFIPQTDYLYRNHGDGISQNENKERSYQYFGEVIFNAMKRRGLKTINGKKIPDTYSNFEEIFQLLDYQNSIPFRIKKKIKIFFQNV